MKRFLDRHKGEVSGVPAAPQEKVRLEVPRCYLDEYLTLINSLSGSIAQTICRKSSCHYHLPTSHTAPIPSSRSIVIRTIESC
jgi:hypothetical protein